MKKVCISCNQEKDISLFEWQKNRPNPRKECKLCRSRKYNTEDKREKQRIYKKKIRKENPDKQRIIWEKSVYGISKEEINIDKCMICGSQRRLCIDHCHNTKIVRGILCTKCNFGLGYFDDNKQKLENAIKYLENNLNLKVKK